MKKSIVFPVINDLTYDQRMQRICRSLAKAGYEVTLIGRELPDSKPLIQQDFQQVRMKLSVNKGKLFYLLYNWKLFWFLLKNDFDIIGSVDVDTLVAAHSVATLKGKPLVFDAHEYFSEVPEVAHRPKVKWVWEKVESWIFPKLKYAYTVNQSLANIFEEKYGAPFEVIHNATVLEDKDFPEQPKDYILYQGAINVGRGLEQIIRAMPYLETRLVICGKGDVFEDCQNLVKELNLERKVEFKDFVPPQELKEITLHAILGLNILAHQGESYYYSLANRFFDYMHSGIPQICSNFPEYRHFNDKYNVALLVDDLETETIVNALKKIIDNDTLRKELHQNCLNARKELNWQNEEKKLLKLFQKISL